MSKIITAAQAAELVQDGCTLTTTGFNGFGCPEDLMMALADHFDQPPKRRYAGQMHQSGRRQRPGREPFGGKARAVSGADPIPHGL